MMHCGVFYMFDLETSPKKHVFFHKFKVGKCAPQIGVKDKLSRTGLRGISAVWTKKSAVQKSGKITPPPSRGLSGFSIPFSPYIWILIGTLLWMRVLIKKRLFDNENNHHLQSGSHKTIVLILMQLAVSLKLMLMTARVLDFLESWICVHALCVCAYPCTWK